MRTPDHVVVTGLSLYYDGLSSWKTAKQLGEIYGESVTHKTILNWIAKFTKLVQPYIEQVLEQQLKLSGKIHHDETEIKVGSEGCYFWQSLDENSRYMVAHLLTESRTSEDAKKVFRQILEKQRPIALFTDGSFAYDDAFKKVFFTHFKAGKVEWVRRVGIRARETNNIIERAHSTLKYRLHDTRNLKNDKSAKTWLDFYIIGYNYCRVHSSIKMTPAQAAGIEIKGWKHLIDGAQEFKTKQEVRPELVQEIRTK
jgi:transposase-like protein